MKKLLSALLIIATLLSAMVLGTSAADTSAWLIGEGATVVCPAEVTKGYAEVNSDLFSTDLSGYNYLHFKMMFAETVNVHYPSFWGYLILTDKEEAGAWESSQNVVSANIAADATYEANVWYDVTLPLAGFAAYGSGSAAIADWTNPCRRFRFVIAASENPELQFKDIYVSVNENDAAPSNEPVEDGGDTSSPETGSALLAVGAVMVLSAGGVTVLSKKRKH